MITEFQGNHRFLSNFWSLKTGIMYANLLFYSVENAYQAAKCRYVDQMVQFQGIRPGDAKRLGKTVDQRADWNEKKLSIMEDLVQQKFFNNPDLAKLLLATGDQELVEGNKWGDRFWGQCPIGTGQNHLGKILMKVRNELLHLSQE